MRGGDASRNGQRYGGNGMHIEVISVVMKPQKLAQMRVTSNCCCVPAGIMMWTGGRGCRWNVKSVKLMLLVDMTVHKIVFNKFNKVVIIKRF